MSTPRPDRAAAIALSILLSLAIVTLPLLALAQGEEVTAVAPSEPEPEPEPAPGEPPTIERREVPDYDGRPEPGPSAGEVLIWIPRVILWPLYAVVEYLVRQPLGYVLTTGEREHWDALRIAPFAETHGRWGIVPTFAYDVGFQPSGGLYLWTDRLLHPQNGMRFSIGFGGPDLLRGSALDRFALDDRGSHVEAVIEGEMRPDRLFLGLGPGAVSERIARYGRRRAGGSLALELRAWRASYVRVSTGLAANEFFDGTFVRRENGELPLGEAVAQGWFGSMPPGIDGYTAYWQRLEGALDTREPWPASGSGARFEAYVEQGVDVTRAVDRRWLRYGGGAGAFWDVDSGRTLALWALTGFATALGRDPVPFTELPDLGGRGRMTAFQPGWITGQSVIAATLEYRYPIWVRIDGFLNVSTGNAFGPHLDGFSPERLRMSFALGVRTVGDPDQSFTIQIGLGTKTFEFALEPEVFRFVVGTQEGF